MTAQRFRRAVTYDVAAEFAARRFDGHVGVSGRRRKAFRENFEVEDEGFHLRFHFFALGRNDARSFRAYWALIGDFRHGLFDDFQALANFSYTNYVAAVAIAIVSGGHVKFKFLLAEVWENLGLVVIQTRRA